MLLLLFLFIVWFFLPAIQKRRCSFTVVCLFVLPDIKKVSVSNFVFGPIRLSMSLEKSISALLIENLFVVIHTYDVGMKTRQKGHIINKLRPRLCGSSLDFEFIRKCMKITNIRPKFHFLKKNGSKNETPSGYVFVIYCLFASRATWKPSTTQNLKRR